MKVIYRIPWPVVYLVLYYLFLSLASLYAGLSTFSIPAIALGLSVAITAFSVSTGLLLLSEKAWKAATSGLILQTLLWSILFVFRFNGQSPDLPFMHSPESTEYLLRLWFLLLIIHLWITLEYHDVFSEAEKNERQHRLENLEDQ